MAKLIDSPIPHPDKPHVVFITLEKDSGERVEIPVRIAHYNSLTAAKKLSYTLECAEYHSHDGPGWQAKRANRRAIWDADDKAKADAAAEAARLAEEAKFVVAPSGFVRDKEGVITHVQVTIQHHGLTYSGAVPYSADKAVFEQSCRDAFAKYETAVTEEKAALVALAIAQ